MNLLQSRNLVPEVTPLSGTIIHGFKVVSASDMEIAEDSVAFARVRGSVGDESYVYEVAPPSVMPEKRKIVRWAIVKKLATE